MNKNDTKSQFRLIFKIMESFQTSANTVHKRSWMMDSDGRKTSSCKTDPIWIGLYSLKWLITSEMNKITDPSSSSLISLFIVFVLLSVFSDQITCWAVQQCPSWLKPAATPGVSVRLTVLMWSYFTRTNPKNPQSCSTHLLMLVFIRVIILHTCVMCCVPDHWKVLFK